MLTAVSISPHSEVLVHKNKITAILDSFFAVFRCSVCCGFIAASWLIAVDSVGAAEDIPNCRIFDSYLQLQQKLIQGNLADGDNYLFELVLQLPNEREKAKGLLRAFIKEKRRNAENQNSAASKLLQELYGLFVCSRPNPDIIYSFLESQKLDSWTANKDIDEPGRPPGWQWKPCGNAMLYTYQATGEERFLNLFTRIADSYANQRDSEFGYEDQARGRILKSWSSVIHVKKGIGSEEHLKTGGLIRTNEITLAGLMVFPQTIFANIIRKDSYLNRKYGSAAERYIRVAEEALEEFESEFFVVPGSKMGYYSMPYDGRPEPLNHTHAAGAVFANLWAYTGKEDFRQRVERLSNYYKASIHKENNGSYSWGYRPTPNNFLDHRSEPIWKMRTTILLPIEAYKQNISFSSYDMKALSKTFLNNIVLPDYQINKYISLKDKKILKVENLVRRGWELRPASLAGLIILDQFDPEVRTVVEGLVLNRLDFFPKCWLTSPITLEAYAYRLLSSKGNAD